MNSIQLTKVNLETAKNWLLSLINEIKDSPLTYPTPNQGNHPLWVLGHVVLSEASIVSVFIEGKENPLAKWEQLFGMGSVPGPDKGKYPSIDQILAEWTPIRNRTLALLDSLVDSDRSMPSRVGPELKNMFGTLGQCFNMVALHTVFHAGQVADARRALGRSPVFG